MTTNYDVNYIIPFLYFIYRYCAHLINWVKYDRYSVKLIILKCKNDVLKLNIGLSIAIEYMIRFKIKRCAEFLSVKLEDQCC